MPTPPPPNSSYPFQLSDLPSLPKTPTEVAFVLMLVVLAALVFGIQWWQHRRRF